MDCGGRSFLPVVKRAEVACWSHEEALAFLKSSSVVGDRFRAVWRLALATGLRRGELVALRWSDIDWDGRRLFVRQAAALDGYVTTFGPPRSRAVIRPIALDAATLGDLRAWRELQAEEHHRLGARSELVVTPEDGKPAHGRGSLPSSLDRPLPVA